MKRLLLLVLVSLFVAACAGTGSVSREQELINRAIAALGGAEAMRGMRSLSISGTSKYREPEQSQMPGGEARFAAEATFETLVDFAGHASRTDWVKNVAYPTPRTFKYSEIVTPDAGYVLGVDSNSRNKQSMESNPPAHGMSGLRLTATHRELRRASPSLLLEMRANPSRVTRINDVDVSGTSHPALRYNAGNFDFIVLFDGQTGLPARVRTLDYDSVLGDSNYDLVFSDWQTIGGVRVAMSQKYELNGRTVIDTRITQVTPNAALPAGGIVIPPAFKAGAAKPAAGNVPYQWVLRRQFIGAYMDSDNASYDTQAGSGLRLQELAPGVQHQVGGTHHGLIVEMRDYLIAFDAPVSDWQSNWTIRTAQAKYGNKPIRYLVLTHHHMDHIGGFRAYAAHGATLVVGAGAGAHYRKLLAMPTTRNPDLAPRDLSGTTIIEVKDKQAFNDGKREVSAHLIDNPHAGSTLIGYVADARIGYVTDIWIPGPPLPAKITSPLQALVNAVRQAGISPTRFAGGHGVAADYGPLMKLAGQ